MDALHPMAVHLPIALVLVWPLVDAVAFFTRSVAAARVGVGLLLLAVATSLSATATGQAAYDAAAKAGTDVEILQSHADLANLVPWLLLVVLAARAGLAARFGRRGHAVGWVLGLSLMPFIVQVGWTGGQLVYRHGVGVSNTAANGR